MNTASLRRRDAAGDRRGRTTSRRSWLALATVVGAMVGLAGCDAPNPVFGLTRETDGETSLGRKEPGSAVDAGGMPTETGVGASGPFGASSVSDAASDGGRSLGLVAYWKLDEAAGATTILDSSGNGNTGRLTGGARFTTATCPAQFTNHAALDFDGLDDFVEIEARTLPPLAKPQSITLWFLYSGIAPPGRETMIVVGNSDTMAGLHIGFDDGQIAVWRRASNTDLSVKAGTPQSGWHHVAYTHNGTAHRVYVDGVPVQNFTLAAEATSITRARLGSSDGLLEMFEGRLDEVRIYDRALSDQDVAALARGAP